MIKGDDIRRDVFIMIKLKSGAWCLYVVVLGVVDADCIRKIFDVTTNITTILLCIWCNLIVVAM